MGFLDYIVDNKAVIAGLEVESWEEAISQGGKVLTDKGVASEEYIETIIKKCKDNGPYIVIAPGIAMPHARPEEGALKLGYGIVTIKGGVSFNDADNDPIYLMIFMAAPDAKLHNEEAIVQVADLCDEEEVIEKIITSNSEEEILSILKNLI